MASRSLWTGSITFGLVNIPVKLHVAVREKELHFHMLHDQDHVRLTRKMVCPADGKEVHSEHTVKGFEISPGQYVIVRDKELEAAAPKRSKTIEIEDFVALDDIDPLFFDRPYYVVPQEQGAKAYRLLVESMEKSKKVGIARFVMRNKEHLCALRPVEGALVLETMHFNDEVVPASEVDVPHKAKSDDRELKMASQLIESLTTKFKPEKYKDTYREAVMEVIQKKAEGEEIVTQPAAQEKKGRVTNLLAALEASLSKAKGENDEKPARPPGHGRARRHAKETAGGSARRHPGVGHGRRKSA
ncbi:MAG: Ku protein [Phycisphaerae bacterium]|nr:Ku protein [Tepidisphaeraceae bacterium]